MLVEVHIPKTAGSALRKVLAREYGDRFRNAGNAITGPDRVEARLRELGAADERSRPAAISGHIVFGLRDLLPADARYLTVLREPVDRVLSHYGYLVEPRDRGSRQPGLLPPGTPHRPELTLEECLDDPRYLPDNLQTRMLVCRRSPFEELPADALEQAKDHLRNGFAFVGLTERFDELLGLLVAVFGWKARFAPRTRVNPGRPRAADVSAQTRRAIEERNLLDFELHALASELFDRAVEQVGSEAELEIDVLRRANELRAGAAAEVVPPGDLRRRLVEARAQLLVQEQQIEQLERKVAKARGRTRPAQRSAARLSTALRRLTR